MIKSKPAWLIATIALASFHISAQTVKFECKSSGTSKPYCNYIKERFESETNHTLKFMELPSSSTEKLGILQQSFAAKSSDFVDVLRIDVIWSGILDPHLMDITEHFSDKRSSFFTGAWDNNIVNGKLKALPSSLDAGLLFYRKDLLARYNQPLPKTWQEMASIAKYIQTEERKAGATDFWGLVFQGKAYEGLTCDAIEWVSSNGGGAIVDKKGNITINNPKAAQALDMAASWIGDISPKGVLAYQEEESRAVFQNGDALFMRNWPYAYVLGQADKSPVKGKIGIMPLPNGDSGHGAAALGGWQWAVNNYSKNKEASLQLLEILISPEAQKMQFMFEGLSPSLTALYDDPEILNAAPHMKEFGAIFADAVARPSSQTKLQYAKVSRAFFNAAFRTLSGEVDGATAIVDLEKRLKRIKGHKWK
ncbi:ABC transporter substrate-binding protein [Vibrio nigripulchritudo]|uniref:ABC transporter substrate-binding protein n=1 Tax=Vibrio nigripulchritudo TaxID=28173 RepID=UPI0024913F43|nr:ABC transporter substrate-binding protein [Vibrio nigripulchritudo]BDU41003.1 ABC transporter substrate-binding protein [Vibrio nigripulchritudo]BDU46743.1 ABC transporter substrate-binding protein [Vibrio nigripulchritudo]